MNEPVQFDLSFPVYFIATKETILVDGVKKPKATVGGKTRDNVDYFALFTKESFAQQYIMDFGINPEDVQLFPVNNAASLNALIMNAMSHVNAIGFDPPPRDAPRESHNNFVVLSKQDVINAIKPQIR